jgi:hypothetical protein
LCTDVGYDIQKMFSPVAIHLNVGIGSDEAKFGWEVSLGVPQALPGYRYNYGETYYSKSYDGINNGKVTTSGGEWAFGVLREASTTISGANSQTLVRTTIGMPGVNIQYENDRDDLGLNLPGMPHAEGDRLRTGAAKFNFGLFSAGVNLMTGEDAGGVHTVNGINYHYEKNVHRLGLLYFGFGPFKIGVNSERIRDFLQNGIHLRNGYPLWDNLSNLYSDTKYWYFGSTGGNTLW